MNDGDNDPTRAQSAYRTAKSILSNIEKEIGDTVLKSGKLPDADLRRRYWEAQEEVENTRIEVERERDATSRWIEDKYGDKPYH
jgi:hypothetical protein